MKYFMSGIRILMEIFLFLVGLSYFIFVSHKVLLYLDLLPGYLFIETLEKSSQEGWLIPLWFQMFKKSIIIVITFLGIYRYGRYLKGLLVVCGFGFLLWLAEYYWLIDLFHRLPSSHVSAFIRWEIIDFLAIFIVFFRQMYLKIYVNRSDPI